MVTPFLTNISLVFTVDWFVPAFFGPAHGRGHTTRLFGQGFIIELFQEEWADVGGTLGKRRGFGIPGVPSLFLASS